MSGGSDPFWLYVEKMADGSMKCGFCKRIYPKTTAHLRIKHHLARVARYGTTLCEKVSPDAQQAMRDQLPNRMHVSMPSSEMQGQPLLDDDLSTWVDSLILPMPDALETGLGTEPADQPFEMDMNNIPSSLMRDVEFSRGKEKMTWELMPSVGERGSSSKRPVDRSVPSSSNNEATNAAATPVRGSAIEQPRLDDGLGGMDILIGGETELVEEPRAPVVLMTIAIAPETKQIAESVVKECAGLPLGIMTMAGSMKRVDDEYHWRDALRQLRISEVRPSDMETEVFRVLKFSYAQLKDRALQNCFLHITLFPKGKNIRREDLIEYLIDEGIVEEMWRHEQFDRGHTMLDQLQNASLLEGSRDDENYRYVKMHDLIWDMARKILKESRGGGVQAGAQLTELPDGTWWRENLLIVSLMENRIKDIPSDFSPRCPNLSTLLLCRNYKLNLGESSFFQHFISLKVLDLSDTDIEKLPGSICHLTSLTVLLLGWCAKLSYVPSLAKLTALKKLDLSYTGLENLPKGLKRLKDLRYLNLYGSGVRVLRPGILSKLSKLQFLKLHQKFGVFLPVSGHEVSILWKLETLECNFSDLENFETFHRAVFGRLIACNVTVGRPSFSLLEDRNYTKSKSDLVIEAWFYDLMIDNALFLSGILFAKVVIVNCQNMRSLCPLNMIHVLKILHLDGLMILETLFEAPSDRFTLPPFYCLKEIVIHKCHRIKVLLPPWLLSTLLQLEVIVVEDCHNMGVIMGTDEEDRIHHMTFPLCCMSLKVLVLKKLPNLNSIYSGRLECDSLEEITVNDCPQLTRIPLTIPHTLKKIQVDPESLRNSIEWAIISEEPVSSPQEDALHS